MTDWNIVNKNYFKKRRASRFVWKFMDMEKAGGYHVATKDLYDYITDHQRVTQLMHGHLILSSFNIDFFFKQKLYFFQNKNYLLNKNIELLEDKLVLINERKSSLLHNLIYIQFFFLFEKIFYHTELYFFLIESKGKFFENLVYKLKEDFFKAMDKDNVRDFFDQIYIVTTVDNVFNKDRVEWVVLDEIYNKKNKEFFDSLSLNTLALYWFANRRNFPFEPFYNMAKYKLARLNLLKKVQINKTLYVWLKFKKNFLLSNMYLLFKFLYLFNVDNYNYTLKFIKVSNFQKNRTNMVKLIKYHKESMVWRFKKSSYYYGPGFLNSTGRVDMSFIFFIYYRALFKDKHKNRLRYLDFRYKWGLRWFDRAERIHNFIFITLYRFLFYYDLESFPDPGEAKEDFEFPEKLKGIVYTHFYFFLHATRYGVGCPNKHDHIDDLNSKAHIFIGSTKIFSKFIFILFKFQHIKIDWKETLDKDLLFERLSFIYRKYWVKLYKYLKGDISFFEDAFLIRSKNIVFFFKHKIKIRQLFDLYYLHNHAVFLLPARYVILLKEKIKVYSYLMPDKSLFFKKKKLNKKTLKKKWNLVKGWRHNWRFKYTLEFNYMIYIYKRYKIWGYSRFGGHDLYDYWCLSWNKNSAEIVEFMHYVLFFFTFLKPWLPLYLCLDFDPEHAALLYLNSFSIFTRESDLKNTVFLGYFFYILRINMHVYKAWVKKKNWKKHGFNMWKYDFNLSKYKHLNYFYLRACIGDPVPLKGKKKKKPFNLLMNKVYRKYIYNYYNKNKFIYKWSNTFFLDSSFSHDKRNLNLKNIWYSSKVEFLEQKLKTKQKIVNRLSLFLTFKDIFFSSFQGFFYNSLFVYFLISNFTDHIIFDYCRELFFDKSFLWRFDLTLFQDLNTWFTSKDEPKLNMKDFRIWKKAWRKFRIHPGQIKKDKYDRCLSLHIIYLTIAFLHYYGRFVFLFYLFLYDCFIYYYTIGSYVILYLILLCEDGKDLEPCFFDRPVLLFIRGGYMEAERLRLIKLKEVILLEDKYFIDRLLINFRFKVSEFRLKLNSDSIEKLGDLWLPTEDEISIQTNNNVYHADFYDKFNAYRRHIIKSPEPIIRHMIFKRFVKFYDDWKCTYKFGFFYHFRYSFSKQIWLDFKEFKNHTLFALNKIRKSVVFYKREHIASQFIYTIDPFLRTNFFFENLSKVRKFFFLFFSFYVKDFVNKINISVLNLHIIELYLFKINRAVFKFKFLFEVNKQLAVTFFINYNYIKNNKNIKNIKNNKNNKNNKKIEKVTHRKFFTMKVNSSFNFRRGLFKLFFSKLIPAFFEQTICFNCNCFFINHADLNLIEYYLKVFTLDLKYKFLHKFIFTKCEKCNFYKVSILKKNIFFFPGIHALLRHNIELGLSKGFCFLANDLFFFSFISNNFIVFKKLNILGLASSKKRILFAYYTFDENSKFFYNFAFDFKFFSFLYLVKALLYVQECFLYEGFTSLSNPEYKRINIAFKLSEKKRIEISNKTYDETRALLKKHTRKELRLMKRAELDKFFEEFAKIKIM